MVRDSAFFVFLQTPGFVPSLTIGDFKIPPPHFMNLCIKQIPKMAQTSTPGIRFASVRVRIQWRRKGGGLRAPGLVVWLLPTFDLQYLVFFAASTSMCYLEPLPPIHGPSTSSNHFYSVANWLILHCKTKLSSYSYDQGMRLEAGQIHTHALRLEYSPSRPLRNRTVCVCYPLYLRLCTRYT